jgi:hypothetical protein
MTMTMTVIIFFPRFRYSKYISLSKRRAPYGSRKNYFFSSKTPPFTLPPLFGEKKNKSSFHDLGSFSFSLRREQEIEKEERKKEKKK